jgi:aromatic amino acid aminotransferase I
MAPPIALDAEGVTDVESAVFPNPLTVDNVSEHRAKSAKLTAGVAAWTSSDLFRSKVGYGVVQFTLNSVSLC